MKGVAMQVYTNTVGRVDRFEADGVVLQSLFGEAAGLELRQVFVAALETMEKHGTEHLVSDLTSLLPLAPADVHWINWTWFPAMKTAGWRRWAIVPPTSPLARAGLRDFVDHFSLLGVTAGEYASVPEARRELAVATEPGTG